MVIVARFEKVSEVRWQHRTVALVEDGKITAILMGWGYGCGCKPYFEICWRKNANYYTSHSNARWWGTRAETEFIKACDRFVTRALHKKPW